MEQVLQQNTAGLSAIMVSLVPGVAGGVALFLILLLVRNRLCVWLGRPIEGRPLAGWRNLLLQIAQGFYVWFFLAGGIYAAVEWVPHAERIDHLIQKIFFLLMFVQAGLLVSRLMVEWARNYMARHTLDGARAMTTESLAQIGHIVVWTIVLLMALDNFGVNITALVAGLGIGGVAVAFAFQNILQDIFASFSLVFDRPFLLGDFIILGDYMGSIEHIGLRSTRMKSLSGEMIIIANHDLLGSRIRNYGPMRERRVVFAFGVEYGTPSDKLAAIPAMVKEAVEAQPDTRFDRSHWAKYGDYSLDFETVYYVLKPDYNLMMDIQQAILLKIYRRFEEEGIGFAFPTQVNIDQKANPGA